MYHLEDGFYFSDRAGWQVTLLVMLFPIENFQHIMVLIWFSFFSDFKLLGGHFSSLGDLKAADQYCK